MHLLKRLELNGFKSFAAKTVLDFPHGITAVVGPNGSGKSNVVDAIRWLLGERDAKHLRGGKVEDLIFAGTPERTRAGMAQASLHFENTGNFFPIDTVEVAVRREVARDGTNRYFVNKAEVLLRDLVDFFARARLGSRGLIVVTQGNSDLFIRVAPAERREMIEEILGLREYQLKRADAERRLEQSQENLMKVSALVEEVGPHLRSLRRQASRWEKRGTLEEELRMLEDWYFGTEWHEIAQGLKSVEKEEIQHQSQGELLEMQLVEIEGKEKKIEQSHPEERKTLVDLRKKIQELISRKGEYERELAKLETQLEFMGGVQEKDDRFPPAAEIMSVVARVREALLEAEEADLEMLQSAVQTALAELESLFVPKPVAREVSPEKYQIRERLTVLTEELWGIEKTIFELRKDEQSLEKSQEDFYKTFTASVREVKHARDALEAWRAGYQKFLLEKERLTLRHEEFMRQIAQIGRKPEEFQSVTGDMGHATSDRNEAERRMLRLRGELAAIGEIDQAVMKEAKETETRFEFLTREGEDLKKAITDLRMLVRNLEEKIKTEFTEALHKINEEFDKFFGLMFEGGHAKLKIARKQVVSNEEQGTTGSGEDDRREHIGELPHVEEEAGNEGIDIEFKLPRKRANSLDILSGGERSLVGIAALFALISVSPPPFLVLDEVDAALDERNARRFAGLLKEFARKTQFIVVTHNRATMEAADVLYGVTIGPDGTSKILSLQLQQAEKVVKAK